MKVISVENVSKKFMLAHGRPKNLADAARGVFSRAKREEFWALNDVSFEVENGEAIGIIGHNGAGKSTMLKLLTQIMQPTSGHIRTRGRVSALIEVGAGFHLEMTGRENIYLNGSILGMTRREIDRKFDEIVAFAELEKFIDTPVKRYSSGMYARLGFAVAAHVDPEILIVDEVLSVGDWLFQKKCLSRMEQVTSGGCTVLYVSHNLNTVRQLCTKAIVLEGGVKTFHGDVSEAIAHYSEGAVSDGQPFVDYTSVARMKHLPEKREVEFYSLEILNSDSCMFVDDASIQFLLKWRYNGDVKPVNIRMEIRYCDDVPITTAFMENVRPNVTGNIAGNIFSYDISMYAPGTYKVLLVLYDNISHGCCHDFDAVWPAFTFTKETTRDPVFSCWNHHGWGHIRNENLSN
ncbi:MAG: ABC transporter ATP-binding protein [Armatimonadota bacterium]